MRQLSLNLASQPIETLTRARKWVFRAAILAVLVTVVQLLFVIQIAANTSRPPRAETLADLPLDDWERQVYLYGQIVRTTSIDELGAAATLADELVSWRSFPWPGMFSDLEDALPDNVRLVRIQPRRNDEGRFAVELTAESMNRTSLNDFFRAVERLETVAGVYPLAHDVLEDGRERMSIELRYSPSEAIGAGPQTNDNLGPGTP